MKKKKAKEKTSQSKIVINWGLLSVTMLLTIIISGSFYLYQVNELATKGYEIRDVELRIQELEKEAKKMEIKEVELRSMYNLEKATQELNLVNTSEISYVEMGSPVAMK